MTPRRIQMLLAFVFLSLGGWALFFPGMVERLGFLPEYRHDSPTSHLLMSCFGAQAILCGTVIALSEFKARTFLVFGLVGSVPFFIFNWYFLYVEPMFTSMMWIDFVGNLAILTLCLTGWYKLRKQEAEES